MLREQEIEKLNCIVKFWKCRRNFQRKGLGGWGRGWKIFSSEHKGCCWSDVSLAAVHLCCKMLQSCISLHCTLVPRPGGHWEQAEEGKIHQKPFGLAWAGILKNSLESARILWNSQESARTLWDQVATDRQGKIEGSGWAYIFPILQPFYLISSRNSWCSRREPAGWAPLHFFCCCLHLL